MAISVRDLYEKITAEALIQELEERNRILQQEINRMKGLRPFYPLAEPDRSTRFDFMAREFDRGYEEGYEEGYEKGRSEAAWAYDQGYANGTESAYGIYT